MRLLMGGGFPRNYWWKTCSTLLAAAGLSRLAHIPLILSHLLLKKDLSCSAISIKRRHFPSSTDDRSTVNNNNDISTIILHSSMLQYVILLITTSSSNRNWPVEFYFFLSLPSYLPVKMERPFDKREKEETFKANKSDHGTWKQSHFSIGLLSMRVDLLKTCSSILSIFMMVLSLLFFFLSCQLNSVKSGYYCRAVIEPVYTCYRYRIKSLVYSILFFYSRSNSPPSISTIQDLLEMRLFKKKKRVVAGFVHFPNDLRVFVVVSFDAIRLFSWTRCLDCNHRVNEQTHSCASN